MLYSKSSNMASRSDEGWHPIRMRESKCEMCEDRVRCLVKNTCDRSLCVVQHPIGWNRFQHGVGEVYAVCYLESEVVVDLVSQNGESVNRRGVQSILYQHYILDYPFDV